MYIWWLGHIRNLMTSGKTAKSDYRMSEYITLVITILMYSIAFFIYYIYVILLINVSKIIKGMSSHNLLGTYWKTWRTYFSPLFLPFFSPLFFSIIIFFSIHSGWRKKYDGEKQWRKKWWQKWRKACSPCFSISPY